MHKPAASSVARGAAAARPTASMTKTKRPPQTPGDPFAAGTATPAAVDGRLRCDMWYGKYLQSELAALSAKKNADARAAEMMKECTMLWAGVSALQRSVTEQKIRADEARFLTEFTTRKSSQKASLQRLLEAAPSTAAKITELAKALEKSENYLQVSGMKVSEGDLDGIREAFANSTQSLDVFEAALDGNKSSMAESLEWLQGDIERYMNAYAECKVLVKKLQDNAIKIVSTNLSEKDVC